MTNDKTKNGRDRRGETLFIDARQLGTMETRVLKIFTDEDIAKIADTVQAWKSGVDYEDVAGFCKSASLEDIKAHGYVLTPGRYVGSEDEIDDGVPFEEKFEALKAKLEEQFTKSDELRNSILTKLNTVEVQNVE